MEIKLCNLQAVKESIDFQLTPKSFGAGSLQSVHRVLDGPTLQVRRYANVHPQVQWKAPSLFLRVYVHEMDRLSRIDRRLGSAHSHLSQRRNL